MKLGSLALGAAVAASLIFSARSQQSLDGYWQGTMVSHGQPLSVAFGFSKGGGRFTSETQAAMDYPLDKVSIDRAHIEFVLGGGIHFSGTTGNDEIAGTFSSGDNSGSFTLHRAAAPRLPYDTEDVTFRNGDVALKGTLCIPRTPGPHAAVVLLQGSGPQSRWGTTRYIADQFARAGVAALTYDKRGSGDSGGDWRTASYDDLARDALAGAALLEAHAGIDPARIGLMGHSQGGAVAPLAATLAPGKVAFIIAEDTFAGSQRGQDIYRVKMALAKFHLLPADFKNAMDTYSLFVDATRGAVPIPDFEKQAALYRNASWYKWMDFPPRDSWIWGWARLNENFDTLPLWRKVRVPVLLVYGEEDALMPVHESIEGISRALSGSGAPHSAVVIPGAQHNLTIQPKPHESFFWWHEAPGLTGMVVQWVKKTERVR